MELFAFIPDRNVYAFFFKRSDGTVRKDDATWATFADANWADYDFAQTELGTSSGVYKVELPSGLVATETYDVVLYDRAGGAAAITDAAIGEGEIGPRGDAVNLTHWLGTAAATPTVAGVPEVDMTHLVGVAQSATDLKDFADDGYDPSTNKVQGVVLVDTATNLTNLPAITANWLTAAGIAAGAITNAKFAAGAIDAAAIADGAIDAATFAAGAIDAAAIAANAIGASELAADAVAEIADAIWDEATAGHTTSGTFGEQCKTDIDAILEDTGTTLQGEVDGIQADTEDIQSRLPAALVGGRMDSNMQAAANGVITATVIATGAVDADALATDAVDEIVAAIGAKGMVLVSTTIATLASQTSFTLTAGSADNDAYNGCEIVVTDASTAAQKAVGVILDYTGSTKTITLLTDPAIFTMATGDLVSIVASRSLKPTVDNRTLDVTPTGAAGIDWANVENPTTALNLSATNIDTDQVTASVSGAVGSVTGNVGGNVIGSVGSVVAGVTLAASAIQAIWDAATSALTTAGSIGKLLVDNINATIGSRSSHAAADIWAVATRLLTAGTNIVLAKGTGVTGFNDLDAAGIRTAVGLGSANLDTQLGNIVADTNELQTDWVDGGRLDTILDSRASSTEVTSIQNNTRVVRVVPEVIERPDSGTVEYRIELLLYDAVGNMEAPDSAPTIALVNQAGTDRSSRLDSATMALVSTGRYRAIYTAAVGDALEQLVWTFSVVEGGATRLYGNQSVIVDTTAVDFTAADRTKLDTLHDTRLTASRATALDNLDATVSSRATPAQVATELGTYDAPTNTEMVAAFTQIKGAGWSTTDTLEAIRDRGDAAWVTATSVTVSDKTGFKLASDGLDLIVPADPSAEPVAGTSSIVTWIGYFGAWSINPVRSDSDSVNLRNTANNADIAAHAISDDGSVFISGAAS